MDKRKKKVLERVTGHGETPFPTVQDRGPPASPEILILQPRL